MKTFKRMASLLMAMVMILSVVSAGLTSLASITPEATGVTVSITVPETIYLKPGTANFQYYIAGVEENGIPNPEKQETGSIKFVSSRTATSIALAYAGSPSVALSKTNISGTDTLQSTISGGHMSNAQSGVITWTFTYVIDSVTYTSTAYTYVYAPALTQTGAQGTHIYDASGGNHPTVNAYAFIIGIHGTAGGKYASGFVGTDDNMYKSPLVEGWNENNVPVAGQYGGNLDLVGNGYFVQKSDNSGGIADCGKGSADNGSSSGAGSAGEAQVDGSQSFGNSSTYGYLYVDSSRYGTREFSLIPNLQAGWMILASHRSGATRKLTSFASTDSAITIAAEVGYTNDWNSGAGKTHGLAFYPYNLNGSIPATETVYTMRADYAIQMETTWPLTSSTTHLTLNFGFKVTPVDKSTLRQTVREAITLNPQEGEYTAPSYDAFTSALQTAATVLGKPDADPTAVNNANRDLSTAIDSLERTPVSVTVLHKLPAKDGFQYTLDGTTYTAAGGYITFVEQMDVSYGYNVTVEANVYPHYSYVATAGKPSSKVYRRVTGDVQHEFIYTPQTSVIYFNYGSEPQYVQGTSTTSLTVTYGQRYADSGTIPTPKMDGWRFDGWSDGNGHTYATSAILGNVVCSDPSAAITYTAQWSCFFAGGHGTQAQPFLISNALELDRIDVETVYCIFNNGSGTSGKYYCQTMPIQLSGTSVATPVLSFNGNYDGSGFAISTDNGTTVSDSTYASVFGSVSGATIRNLRSSLGGTLRPVGSGNTYVGFFGNVTGSTIENVDITFSGSTVSGANSGIFAGAVSDSAIRSSSVTLNEGSVSGDAFIGSKGSGTVLYNTWTLLNDEPTGYTGSNTNNRMHVRENGSVQMESSNSQYTFTAYGNAGWSEEFRDAADTKINQSAPERYIYQPAKGLNGADVYACFVKEVTFTADERGSVVGAGTYELRQGETVSGLEPRPEAGFSFAGWTNPTDGTLSGSSPYSFTMGTTGGTILANFSVGSFYLAYDTNGAVDVDPFPESRSYSTDTQILISSVEQIRRTGYTCTGWNTQPDGSGSAFSGNTEVSALALKQTYGDSLTLYAMWQKNVYTVTFKESDGSVVGTEQVEYNDQVTMPVRTKPGYKGLIWYEQNDSGAPSGSGYLPNSKKTITGKTTFKASWTPINFKIEFSSEPGVDTSTMPATQTYSYDANTITLPEMTPQWTGRVFIGWNTSAQFNGDLYHEGDVYDKTRPTEDNAVITLYAQWSTASFTATWDLNGGTLNGSSVNPQTTVVFGGTYATPDGEFKKPASHFVGWYTERTGGTIIENGSTVSATSDPTFYAHWGPSTYTVAFDANGGTGTMESFTATYGVPFTLPPNTFTRLGYTFTGWQTQSGMPFTDEEPTNGMLTSEDGGTVTMFAQWSGRTFKIVYKFSYPYQIDENTTVTKGIAYSTMQFNLGTSVVMGGSEVTLKSYDAGTQTVQNGDTQDRYEFYGWSTSAENAVGMNVAYQNASAFTLTEADLANLEVDWTKSTPTITLYASWARYVTVTWDLWGGLLNGSDAPIIEEMLYGQHFNPPSGVFLKSRHIPMGWWTQPYGAGTQVTEDTTLWTNDDITLYLYWQQIQSDMTSTYQVQYFLELATRNPDGTYDLSFPDDDHPYQTDTLPGNVDTWVTAVWKTFPGYSPDEYNDNNVITGKVKDNDLGETLVLKLYYNIDIHYIRFDRNGGSGSMPTLSIVYGENMTLPTHTFTRSGYDFIGWSETRTGNVVYPEGGRFVCFGEDVRLYAQWQLHEYQITYHLDGGELPAGCTNPTTYTAETDSFDLYNPERTGYVFDGWTGTGLPDMLQYVTVEIGTSGDLEFWANWTIIPYDITYDLANGTLAEPNPTSYDVETPTFTLNNPSRTGYTFAGWTGSNGDVPQTTVQVIKGTTGTLHFTATYQPISYNVTYELHGGTVTPENPTSYSIASDPITLRNPVKTGYGFTGWTGSNGDVPQTTVTISRGSMGDKAFEAHYDPNTYSIAFNANGGENTMDPISAVYDQYVSLPKNLFTRTGYDFRGWALSADATSKKYSDEDENVVNLTAEDQATVTLYAFWEPKLYTIHFLSNGGSPVADMRVAYNTAVTPPADPVREGYRFLGWDPELPDIMPANDVWASAKWRSNAITVTFYPNGGAGRMDPVKVNFEETYVLPAGADVLYAKTGFSFGGWLDAPEGLLVGESIVGGEENIDLYAKWNPIHYFVQFFGNGATSGTMNTMEYEYGTTYALPTNEYEKTGAEFKGWSTSENGVVAYTQNADIISLTVTPNEIIPLYAVWNDIHYLLTFDTTVATSGSVDDMDVVYNQTVNLPDGAELECFSDDTQVSRTLIGWVDSNNVQYGVGDEYVCPVGGESFTAVWSANYYYLDLLASDIEGYRNNDAMPAGANDPDYAEGGEYAELLGTDGVYPWFDFDTVALENALDEVYAPENRNLPQGDQPIVNSLTVMLQRALEAVTLWDADFDERFYCNYAYEGEMDDVNWIMYPACEDDESHSFNSMIELLDELFATDEESCLYTAESVQALYEMIYGNGVDVDGIVIEAQNANLKLPAQDLLYEYVDRMASAYHTVLVLKNADYSDLDALITEYLPSKNGVEYRDLEAYYTADRVQTLKIYYANIDRNIKNINEWHVKPGGDIYNQLKTYIDNLVPGEADYTNLFYEILNIPSGSADFSWPAQNVIRAVYPVWIRWARNNDGNISAQLDTAYLNARYTASSIDALNRVLDSFDWNLDIFHQYMIDNSENGMSYVNRLRNVRQQLELRKFTVTFKMNDGTGSNYMISRNHEYGMPLGTMPSSNPTRDGYVFKGWSSDPDELVTVDAETYVYEDMFVYAIWGSVEEEAIELVAKEGSTTYIDTTRNYIYGLKPEITRTELLNVYLEVHGNGRIEIATAGALGTGTVVNLINNATDEVLETYYLVIFGDLNGDGRINANDTTEAQMYAAQLKDSSTVTPFVFAGDVFVDGRVNTNDVTKIQMLAVSLITIDQVTREKI